MAVYQIGQQQPVLCPILRTDAFHVLERGLCELRRLIFENPTQAFELSVALHNIPSILASDDTTPDAVYLKSLVDQAMSIIQTSTR